MRKQYNLSPEFSARVVKEVRQFLQERKDVDFAFIYGSSVELKVCHDLDLGIHITEECLTGSTDRAIEIAGQLSQRLQVPFDVRTLNGAPVSFLFHVLRGRLVFCRDEQRLADMIEFVLPRYFDKRDFLRHYAREAFAR